MKKLLLLAAFGVAGLVSAKSSVATDLKKNDTFAKESSITKLLTKYHIIFQTPCGVFHTYTDNNYSDAELITAFVGITESYCGITVNPDDVTVEP